MKSLAAIIKGLIYSVTLFLGLYMLLKFFAFDDWKFMYRTIAYLKDFEYERAFFGGVGSFLVMLHVTLLYLSHRSAHAKRAIQFESSLGRIKVSYKAIKDFVTDTATVNPLVASCETDIIKKSGAIAVRMMLHVYPDLNVVELSKEVQLSVKEGLSSIMGIDNTTEIVAQVREVTIEKVL